MLFLTFHFLFLYFFGSFEHHTRLAKRNFELSKFGVEARESALRNNPCASILAVFILSMKKLKSASSHGQMPVNENTGHSLFERRLTKKKLIQCLEWGIHCNDYPLTTPFKSDYKVHQNMGIKVKLNHPPHPPCIVPTIYKKSGRKRRV